MKRPAASRNSMVSRTRRDPVEEPDQPDLLPGSKKRSTPPPESLAAADTPAEFAVPAMPAKRIRRVDTVEESQISGWYLESASEDFQCVSKSYDWFSFISATNQCLILFECVCLGSLEVVQHPAKGLGGCGSPALASVGRGQCLPGFHLAVTSIVLQAHGIFLVAEFFR